VLLPKVTYYKDLELQIKTLQDALRDTDKLEWLSELKGGEKRQQQTIPIEDTQELVTEI
jgi:hypothetical protein